MKLSDTDFKIIYNKTQGDPNHPLLQKLSKNLAYSYQFAEYLMENKKEVPDIIVKGIAEDSYYSSLFAILLIKNNKEVPEIILQGISTALGHAMSVSKYLIRINKKIPDIILQPISKDSHYSFNLAEYLFERDKEVPETIVQAISKNSEYSYYFAMFLVNNNREVSDIIVQSISKGSYYSYKFAKYLIKNKKEIPDIIKKSARQFNGNLPELKENIFKKLHDKVLLEMPYLFNLSQDNIPNTDEHFDLELENHKTEEKLITFFKELFSIGKKTDKYGNSIIITSPQDKINLFNKIYNDKQSILFIKNICNLKSPQQAQNWLLRFK